MFMTQPFKTTIVMESSSNDQHKNDSTLQVSISEQTGASDEGFHVTRLREVLQKTVKKCLDGGGRYSHFARSYNFVHKEMPEALHSIREQFLKNLESSIEKELNLLIEEEDLVKLFNSLDKHILDASTQSTQPAWRPSGDPVVDSRAHRMQPKLREKDRLESLLRGLQEETGRLQGALAPREQHLLDTKQKITQAMETFDEAATSCKKIPMSEMEGMIATLSGVQ